METKIERKPIKTKIENNIQTKIQNNIETKIETKITVTSKKMGLRKSDTCVHTYINSKRIELESPGCTGFEENSKCFKT